MRKTIFQAIKSMWCHMQRRRQFQFLLLLMLMLISSLVEMVSIGSVLPFIGALINPDQVFNHPKSRALIHFFSISYSQDLLFLMTLIFCVAAISTGIFRLFVLYAISRFSFSIGADFSLRAYRNTLYQPYAVHIARNSSELINGIIGKVAMLIGSVLMPLLTLISSGILLTSVLFMLLLIDPTIAIAASFVFGSLYLISAFITRRSLRENSECIARESTLVIKALQEGLGGIRDVLIDGTQETYCTIYRNADLKLRNAQARNNFASVSPRYITEMSGMVMIAVLAYNMSKWEGGISAALPVLGGLAVGAQRLLPVLQQGYNAFATILGAEAPMLGAIELLEQSIPENAQEGTFSPLPFEYAIELKNIGFRYSQDGDWILRHIDLKITKGKRVGFIGSTGAGKSTLLDIIMSLLLPSEGTIEVDGRVVDMYNFRNWQSHVAHVPQTIYLSDCSIEENIAFGIPKKAIDVERVVRAAKQAQIHKIIEGWPEKYQTIVGERGVRLSGGQRQRIGIARALYKQADVIIFDEATSALDNETERVLMDAIDALSPDLTILSVAHRLTTLRNCDFIVELSMGKVSRIGSYQELVTNS